MLTYYDNMHPHYDKVPNPYRDPNNDIWEGRKPHHIDRLEDVGKDKYHGAYYPDCAEYRFWCGQANISLDGRIKYASVSLNYKVGLYIIGNKLHIYDIRNDGSPYSFGYSAEDGKQKDIWPHNYWLEDERIDAMLREKNIDCPVWPLICRRAKEIWLEEISNRPKLRQYTPEYND